MNTEARDAAGGRASRPMTLSRPAAREQLTEAAAALASRLDGLGVILVTLPGKSPERPDHALERTALTHALMLFSTDETARRIAAEAIVDGFIDPAQLVDPTWWTCDLARALAREIGYVEPVASRTMARHALHVSRQAVDQMVVRGDLDEARGHERPGVTRESLARAMRRRFPYAADGG